MKSIIKVLLSICIAIICLSQVSYASDSIVTISNNMDFLNFITSSPNNKKAKLSNNIVLDSLNISYASRDFDMNGYSFIIPQTVSVCVKANTENAISRFYSPTGQPIFIVEGMLELYAGELSSSASGTLIQINDNGRLYTKNPVIEETDYPNDKGLEFGRPSIYDNQIVKLSIPNGTAISGGKETAYYHTDITAKNVIESSIKPIFYYSTIKSNQDVEVVQGIYNDVKNIKNISIWKHQLVMSIDDTVTSVDIAKYLPKEITTKDNQYLTVEFDSSTFDESLEEQILYGKYHNINNLYLPYLPELKLKIVKNKQVPLSQFYATFNGRNSLFETGLLSPRPINAPINININYMNAENFVLQYSQNIDFINAKEYEFFNEGYTYPIRIRSVSISPKDTMYFRLHILDGLQKGYSNIVKIEKFHVYYVSEPESDWIEDDENNNIIPPPSTDNDITDEPNTLPEDGNDHRNDSSIDEPKDESEVIIKEEEISSSIKAEEDIVVDLKQHQVTIPYETATQYQSNDIVINEYNNKVEIKNDENEINDSSITIIQKENKDSSHSMLVFIVIIGVLLSVLCFFKYQRRVK
ncbi:MAG: hypothetical protein RR428_06140 [Coprobacillus sp.]